jgi:hypothetical protein
MLGNPRIKGPSHEPQLEQLHAAEDAFVATIYSVLIIEYHCRYKMLMQSLCT